MYNNNADIFETMNIVKNPCNMFCLSGYTKISGILLWSHGINWETSTEHIIFVTLSNMTSTSIPFWVLRLVNLLNFYALKIFLHRSYKQCSLSFFLWLSSLTRWRFRFDRFKNDCIQFLKLQIPCDT